MRDLRKGWIKYDGCSRPIHVLVDDLGLVFAAGAGGWSRPSEHAILKLLPGTIPYKHWRSDQWYTGNWKDPSWAWIYGAPGRR